MPRLGLIRAGASSRCLLVPFVFAVLSACAPSPTETGSARPHIVSELPPIDRYAERDVPRAEPVMSLVGREDFHASQLSVDQRLWFERLGSAIDASRADMVRRAEADNLYNYGRWLFQYNHALLLGLRTTGDLRFLDEVDVVTEAMRAELRDAWCGSVADTVEVNIRYGTVQVPDGYLNFRYRGNRSIHDCRDITDLDETLTHGHLAMVMYAYHVNRHLESPSGIDYGERADFWLAYLRENFEAKWRQRSRTSWPAMDFIDLKFCHTYHQMLLYYYFVGKRLQDDGAADAGPYLRHAMRMTDGMFDVPYVAGRHPGGFVQADTPLGAAVVYSFGAPGSPDVNATHFEACPMTYARYMLTSLMALYLEGFDRWDDDIMTKLANGLAHFVMDTDPVTMRRDPFAAGVTGAQYISGMPPTRYRGRNSLTDYTLTPFAAFEVWERSGKISSITQQVLAEVEADLEHPQQVFVPASLLFAATVEANGD